MPALEKTVWVDATADSVTLRISVGHGQPGFTRVKLDGKLVAESDKHDPTTLAGLAVELGPPGPLAGKVIDTITVIEELNPATNETSMLWRIDEASPPLDQPLNESASPGEQVVYNMRIRLKVENA